MPKYTLSWWIHRIFSPLKFNHTECDGDMTKYTSSWCIPSILSPLKLNHTVCDEDISSWCIPSILSPLKLNHTEWDGDTPKHTFSLGIPWIFSPLKLNHTEWKKRLSVQVLPLMTLNFTQALWSCKSEIVNTPALSVLENGWLQRTAFPRMTHIRFLNASHDNVGQGQTQTPQIPFHCVKWFTEWLVPTYQSE